MHGKVGGPGHGVTLCCRCVRTMDRPVQWLHDSGDANIENEDMCPDWSLARQEVSTSLLLAFIRFPGQTPCSMLDGM